jgi:hypothetical protein
VYFGVLQAHATTDIVGRGYAQKAGALPTELTGHCIAVQEIAESTRRTERSIVPDFVPDFSAILRDFALIPNILEIDCACSCT